MDVATTTKNFVDTGTTSKSTGGTAEQLLGDFSAAVAERMKQAGKVTGEQGKTTMVSHLDAKTDTMVDSHAQNDAPDSSARNRTEDPAASRHYDDAPQDRADTPTDTRDTAPAHDDVATSDAPREAAHDDAPAEHADDAPQDTSHDEQSASGDDTQGNEGDTQGDQSSQAAETDGAIQDETPQVAAQHVAAAPVAEVLAGVATKSEGAKAAAGDATQKQNTVKGPEIAQNVGVAQKAADGTTTKDNAELAQTPDGKKAKSTAAQAQTGQNTHVKAETQTGGDKGATVVQQQAADLAKKVGGNQALNVNVNVNKPSEELVSKPMANLAGQANAKGEGESLTPTVAGAAAKGQATQSAANNQAGQNGADGQAQNQQQAQAAQALAAQAQAAKAAATATEGKVAQATDAASTTQSVKAGGGEAASTTQATAPSAGAQQTQQAAATQKPQAMPHQQTRAQVTEQVTVQISKAIADGVDKIRIQLKPAHLGRVDVQLDISKDGHVTAVVSADNKDTLDLLKQDQRALERALREAGLNLGSNDLSFSMRGQNGEGADQQDTAQNNGKSAEPLLEPTLEELLQAQSSRPNIISEDRIDVTA